MLKFIKFMVFKLWYQGQFAPRYHWALYQFSKLADKPLHEQQRKLREGGATEQEIEVWCRMLAGLRQFRQTITRSMPKKTKIVAAKFALREFNSGNGPAPRENELVN
jgi:hypothetical protein